MYTCVAGHGSTAIRFSVVEHISFFCNSKKLSTMALRQRQRYNNLMLGALTDTAWSWHVTPTIAGVQNMWSFISSSIIRPHSLCSRPPLQADKCFTSPTLCTLRSQPPEQEIRYLKECRRRKTCVTSVWWPTHCLKIKRKATLSLAGFLQNLTIRHQYSPSRGLDIKPVCIRQC